jgi:hypothetical protein
MTKNKNKNKKKTKQDVFHQAELEDNGKSIRKISNYPPPFLFVWYTGFKEQDNMKKFL